MWGWSCAKPKSSNQIFSFRIQNTFNCSNVTSSTKPEIHNILHIVVRGGPSHGHGQHVQKISWSWTCGFWYASGQTYRHTDALIITLLLFAVYCFFFTLYVAAYMANKVVYIIIAGVLEYQAQSPDEGALVNAARNFGFVFRVCSLSYFWLIEHLIRCVLCACISGSSIWACLMAGVTHLLSTHVHLV